MANSTEIPVLLSTDAEGKELDKSVMLYVEARPPEGEAEVAFGVVEGLDKVTAAIRAIAGDVAAALRAVAPDKYTVEMGFELKAEAGGLVALLVRSGGTATINVTLEWAGSSGAVESSGG
jgi:hypothetical protein